MSNPNKAKGDRGEREAKAVLLELAPDLCVPHRGRTYGAGRGDDRGDIDLLPDCTVQVRNLRKSDIGQAVRSSAIDAVTQSGRDRTSHAVGMVPVPRARRDSVRWLACTLTWPIGLPTPGHGDPALPALVGFGTVGKLLTWVRDDTGPDGYLTWPRPARVAVLGGGAGPVYVAPLEAWLDAYRIARAGHDMVAELGLAAPATSKSGAAQPRVAHTTKTTSDLSRPPDRAA